MSSDISLLILMFLDICLEFFGVGSLFAMIDFYYYIL